MTNTSFTGQAILSAAIVTLVVAAGLLFIGAGPAGENGNERPKEKNTSAPTASYKRDIMPVFRRYCLPCHSEEECNPSGFVANSYETLMRAAKHGPVLVPGMPDSSHLIQKISPAPPFGDPMPLRAKGPFPKDTLQLLWRWIKQGAKNN